MVCDCRFKVHFGHQFSINLWKSIMNIQTQSKNWPYQTLTSGNVIDFLDNNWCSVIVCICLAVSLTSVMRRVRHSHKCFLCVDNIHTTFLKVLLLSFKDRDKSWEYQSHSKIIYVQLLLLWWSMKKSIPLFW